LASPRSTAVDKLLVLSLGWVKLGEFVALVVGGDIEGRKSLLATDDEGTCNDGVIGGTIDRSTAEDVLAGGLKTGEETADKVRGHEDLGQLVVVLVVNLPERVLLRVDVLPEPLERIWSVVVGVLTLPLIKGQSCLGQSFKRMLWLWCRWGLLFLLNLLGLWLRGGLGCGLLRLLWLLGCLVLDSLINEVEVATSNRRVDGLVVDGLVPTGNVGVLSAPLLVEEVLETTRDDASSEQISKGDTLASQVCVVKKVLLNNIDCLESGLLGFLNVLLVVCVTANEGTEPATKRREDLGVEV
jgi:hypothetical protein